MNAEILRGFTDAIILNVLLEGDSYGYKVSQSIIERTNKIVGEITDAAGLTITAGELNGVIIGTKGKARVKTIGCGGYNTDVIVNNENQWQIDTYIFTGPFLPGTKSTKAEGFFFDADAAKAEFSDKDAESVILLLPKPKCFGIRNGKETQWLDSGDEINGSTVATFRYFRKHLKELI